MRKRRETCSARFTHAKWGLATGRTAFPQYSGSTGGAWVATAGPRHPRTLPDVFSVALFSNGARCKGPHTDAVTYGVKLSIFLSETNLFDS
jgi:hypothetical protein